MNMIAEGRPTKQEADLIMPDQNSITTHTGNRALMVDEPLIFEIGSSERSGVDLPEAPAVESRLGGLEREAPIAIPGLVRGRNGASLHKAQPSELCHRRWFVPARKLHDEAQPPAQ